jgi:uncharacterized phiE125 gp8 family phage protein
VIPLLQITDTSPAPEIIEPLMLSEVKGFAQIPDRSPSDAEEDAQLEAMISAARVVAEGEQNCDLVTKQWDLSYDYWPCSAIPLRFPLQSVDLVQYLDSDGTTHDLTENTHYVVDAKKGVIVPPYNQSWPSFTPWPSSAILIRFTSGHQATSSFWQEAGDQIRLGMKYLVNYWYTERIPIEMTNVGVQEYPFTITHLLRHGARYRRA